MIAAKSMSLQKIKELIAQKKSEGRSITLCYGHFNVIHPGHLRYLNFAKKDKNTFLVVAIQHEDFGYPDENGQLYPQNDRAAGVSSLEMVDCVYQLPGSIVDFIVDIKPDIYIKGREFEGKMNMIAAEMTAMEEIGGKVVFSSGDAEYAKHDFLEAKYREEKVGLKLFRDICHKYDVDFKTLTQKIEGFSKLNMLVIGDTIVDQFCACDTLGVSSEAPVLAIRELESKEYIGGAAIVAAHLRSMGANCHYVSVIGNDEAGQLVSRSLDNEGITATLLPDESRPTTFKIRYMVENQKILRVSRLRQTIINSKLEASIIADLEKRIPTMDGIIISDFVYGVITPNILSTICELAKSNNVKVFGDLQCSSQIGDVTKFTGIELITPTEKEARIALHNYTSGLEVIARDLLNKTKNRSIIITLGSEGLLAYSKNEKGEFHSLYMPALSQNPVDVAGAGDALLTGFALSKTSNMTMAESAAVANCLSAISVMRIGNIPINTNELKQYIAKTI